VPQERKTKHLQAGLRPQQLSRRGVFFSTGLQASFWVHDPIASVLPRRFNSDAMQQRFGSRQFLAAIALAGFCLGGQFSALAGKPDLTVHKRLLKASALVERAYFTSEDCDYVEGCIVKTGIRKLLRVDVGLANVGKSDLVIGDPRDHIAAGDGLFVWSPCHQHYHMKTMVKYRILNLNFMPVTKGRKQAFCLRDNYRYTSTAGESSGFTCLYQGITAGWEDVYDKSLACQYVDITGVPPGTYYLQVTVNPLQVFPETSYLNNTVIVQIQVPYLPYP